MSTPFFRNAVLAAVLAVGMIDAAAASPLSVSGAVGGAPTGVTRDNLDWLPLGNAGGVSPQSGIKVTFFPNAQAVQGSVVGQYAAPFLSGGNGTGFGNDNGVNNPPAGNQPNGADATTYITSGSTGSIATAAVEILLPDNGGLGYLYFGLLWGSVDTYNTLSFYYNTTLIGSITGSDVTASPNGDQGVNGTLYVNITSTQPFNRIVATSSQFAFEFDNLAFNPTVPVPEPASLALLGAGLLGLGLAARRRG